MVVPSGTEAARAFIPAMDFDSSKAFYEAQKKATVPPDAPIVAFAPGDKGDLKPGVKIFIVAAKKQADGSLQTPRIAYGKDGLTPPM